MLSPAMSDKQLDSITTSEDAKIALWVGAVSAGKTIASLFAFLFAVRHTKGAGLIVITGKTLQTIERNIINVLQNRDLFGELAEQVIHTRGQNTAIILGRVVELVGANDVRAEEKIRGGTVELAYVDEATILPSGFWEMLITRLRVPGARLLATTNPGSTRHWLRVNYILDAAGKNMVVFHFTMDDNPSLTPDYIRDMKASFTGVFYDRFILGKWTNAEGAVYDIWDPTRHVTPWEQLPPMRRMLCTSIDFGTQHPTAAVMLGLGYDRRLYLVDELRIDVNVTAVRQSPSQQSKTIRDWMTNPARPHLPGGQVIRPEWVVVDSAAADFRQELFVDGVSSVGAKKDVVYGIGLITSLLGRDAFKVTDRCTGVLDEITEYVWDPKAAERGEDAPDKAKARDDSLDAMRYAVTTTETLWRGELLTDQPDLAA